MLICQDVLTYCWGWCTNLDMEETLIKVGLTPEEVELYVSLLNVGAQSAAQLASNTSVKRTYVYRVASSLTGKGLVTEAKRGRATVFEPNSPDHLLSLAEAKKLEAEQTKTNIESLLGSLKTKYSSVESRPIVETFHGIEGVKKIYLDTLKVGKEISAVVETTDVEPQLRDWIKNRYVKERAKQQIHAKVILASGKLASEYQSRNTEAYRTVIEVPHDKFPIKHEVDIYGNKVAFINYRQDEPIVGLVIDNDMVAKTMKAWFDLSWIGAEKVSAKNKK